ncbi:MAG TPA: proton-conducting transporter membrane subunit [Kofleriaceae bacterium]|nr:proton-conducting transporter membrane subunit [Kofleriaceae bacterium]
MTGCLIAVAILFGSALVSLLAGRHGRAAQAIAATGCVAAAGCAIPAAIASLAGAPAAEIAVSWAPPVNVMKLGLDPLSAFFIVPIVALGAVCAIYGAFYLDDQRTRRWLAFPACFFNLLVAAMLLVVMSRDAISLLVTWEIMSLASYFLVVFDHAQADVRRAGWVYLIASHLGMACLVSAFVLLGNAGLGFAEMMGQAPGTATAAVAALLALIGFGVKAGIVPLHVWLPEAHAAAPSHVSALMSGIMIKLGIYGILRTISITGPALPWGPVLLGLGVAGALVGISLAIYQRDLKRALAYSSVENVGIILIGLGVGLWGASAGHPEIAALGLWGGLLHIWNHVVMKGLMFLGAGSLVHGARTRDLEAMGGLLKTMPRTGALLVLGTVAIAALPPLNGFASEWLIYLGLARGGIGADPGWGLALLFAVTVMAAVGVLAALCFVRIIGIGLFGQPRSEAARHAHESGRGIVGPIAVLAAAAIALPFGLPLIARSLDRVAAQLTSTRLPGSVVTDALGLPAILSLVLWAGCIATYLVTRRLMRRRRVAATWGCGYVAPTARMQYSAASFAEGIHRLLPGALRARIVAQQSTDLFPTPGTVSADRQDPFTRAAYQPLLDRAARRFAQLRWVQQGLLHLYILYVVLAVVVVITIVSIRDWVMP